MDEETAALTAVLVCVIAVHREHGEERDELYALAEHVGDRDIVRLFIVGIQREHAFCEGIHHIVARSLHDDVACEGGGQSAEVGKKASEFRELVLAGHSSEEEEVNGLLVAEALLLDEALDYVLDVDAAVVELAVAVIGHTVAHIEHLYRAYIGKTGDNAVAVYITEPALDVVLGVELRVYPVAVNRAFCELGYFGDYF